MIMRDVCILKDIQALMKQHCLTMNRSMLSSLWAIEMGNSMNFRKSWRRRWRLWGMKRVLIYSQVFSEYR